MAGLDYRGPNAVDPTDIVNRGDLLAGLNTAAVNRTDVAGQVSVAAGLRASKTYIDNQDALYALPSYYQNRDALNIPVASRGAANGVASLDSNGKIPLAQLPALGAGYLLGPFGPRHLNASVAVFSGSTGSTPLKICDWELGSQSVSTFRPLAFMNALVSCTTGGWPVIEVKISDGAAAYADQTLVARGYGRTSFTDAQSVTVIPCPHTTGASGTSSPPTYSTPYLTAWLYDANGHSVTLGGSGVINAVIFLLRTAE